MVSVISHRVQEQRQKNRAEPLLTQQTGFEGLSASADGKTLYLLLQAAANQEGVSPLHKRHSLPQPQGSNERKQITLESVAVQLIWKD